MSGNDSETESDGDSNIQDDNTLESTQINVEYESDDNDEDIALLNVTIVTTDDTVEDVVLNSDGNENISEHLLEETAEIDENFTISSNTDLYHNFLQTELGLYHDNIAHMEDVDYLVWVLEKYDAFMSKNN